MAENGKYGPYTKLFLEIQPERTEPTQWRAEPYGYFKERRIYPTPSSAWAFR
jgi:hypothetical protein